MKKDITYLLDKKKRCEAITMVTCYDYPTARIQDAAGIDSVLVGDSVGTNVLGYASEREVTLEDMTRHTAAVARAVKSAFIVADLPYGYASDADKAIRAARALIDCGADCVKIEGWGEVAHIIQKLSDMDMIVCSHIGYNPQIHDKPKVFGKDDASAKELLDGAKALQDAGAKMIVLEMVPKVLSGEISKVLDIPTIGIGSGNLCDGQVLVVNDLLGLSPKVYKHARPFLNLRELMNGAFKDYISAVETRSFPGDENCW